MTVNEFRITSHPPRSSPFGPSSGSSQTAIRIVYHSKANTTTHTHTLSHLSPQVHAQFTHRITCWSSFTQQIRDQYSRIGMKNTPSRPPNVRSFLHAGSLSTAAAPVPPPPQPPPPAVARNTATTGQTNLRPYVFIQRHLFHPHHTYLPASRALSGIPRIYFSLYQTRINQIKQWLSLDLILNGWRHARSHKYGNI